MKKLILFFILFIFPNYISTFYVSKNISLGNGKVWKDIYLDGTEYKTKIKKEIILHNNEYRYSPEVDLLIHFNHTEPLSTWKGIIGNYRILKKDFIFSKKNKVFGTTSAKFSESKNVLVLDPLKNSTIFTKNNQDFTIEFWIYPESLSKQSILEYIIPFFKENSEKFYERGIKVQIVDKKLEWNFLNLFSHFDFPNEKKNQEGFKSFKFKSKRKLALHQWSHHCLSFNYITNEINYFVNGVKEAYYSIQNHFDKKNSLKLSFPKGNQGFLVIGKKFFGYIDELIISKYVKTNNLKRIMFQDNIKKNLQSKILDTQYIKTSPYIIYPGFVLSKIYDLKSKYSFLRKIKINKKEPEASYIQLQYRMSDSYFNESDEKIPWQNILTQKNLVAKKSNQGRYFQWRAILKSSHYGKYTPSLYGLDLYFEMYKNPPSPQNLKVFKDNHNIVLEWYPPQLEKNIKEYRLYYGIQSKNYFLPNVPVQIPINNIANHSNPQFILKDLKKGHSYFFSITLVDLKDVESDFSNEVFIHHY